jgi:DNA-binding protein YbaB
MTSAFESAINDAMAQLEKQRKDLARLQQNVDQVTATVKARRRHISATANGRGEITGLKFHGQAYRSMSAEELAKVILETIQEARQAAQKEVWSTIADTLPEGAAMEDVVSGNYDWSKELNGALQMPQALTDLLAQPPTSLFEKAGFDAFLDAATGQSEPAAGNGAKSTPNRSERDPRRDQ